MIYREHFPFSLLSTYYIKHSCETRLVATYGTRPSEGEEQSLRHHTPETQESVTRKKVLQQLYYFVSVIFQALENTLNKGDCVGVWGISQDKHTYTEHQKGVFRGKTDSLVRILTFSVFFGQTPKNARFGKSA